MTDGKTLIDTVDAQERVYAPMYATFLGLTEQQITEADSVRRFLIETGNWDSVLEDAEIFHAERRAEKLLAQYKEQRAAVDRAKEIKRGVR